MSFSVTQCVCWLPFVCACERASTTTTTTMPTKSLAIAKCCALMTFKPKWDTKFDVYLLNTISLHSTNAIRTRLQRWCVFECGMEWKARAKLGIILCCFKTGFWFFNISTHTHQYACTRVQTDTHLSTEIAVCTRIVDANVFFIWVGTEKKFASVYLCLSFLFAVSLFTSIFFCHYDIHTLTIERSTMCCYYASLCSDRFASLLCLTTHTHTQPRYTRCFWILLFFYCFSLSRSLACLRAILLLSAVY